MNILVVAIFMYNKDVISLCSITVKSTVCDALMKTSQLIYTNEFVLCPLMTIIIKRFNVNGISKKQQQI